jgi:hypothetical protein
MQHLWLHRKQSTAVLQIERVRSPWMCDRCQRHEERWRSQLQARVSAQHAGMYQCIAAARCIRCGRDEHALADAAITLSASVQVVAA